MRNFHDPFDEMFDDIDKKFGDRVISNEELQAEKRDEVAKIRAALLQMDPAPTRSQAVKSPQLDR